MKGALNTIKRNFKDKSFIAKNFFYSFVFVSCFFSFCFLQSNQLKGQSMPFPPPNQMQVYSIQQLSFGSFYTGAGGGSVIINPTGMRSSTGSIVLAGGACFQSIYEIRLIPGRLIQIQLGPTAILARIGGGGTMSMTIGPTDRGTSFVTTGGHPFRNLVNIGGELFVGNININPAGNYEGSFSVTFIQE